MNAFQSKAYDLYNTEIIWTYKIDRKKDFYLIWPCHSLTKYPWSWPSDDIDLLNKFLVENKQKEYQVR